MADVSLLERLQWVHAAIEESVALGLRPDLEQCRDELEGCMLDDVAALLMEPMRTEPEWVNGLAAIREKLSGILQTIDHLADRRTKMSRTNIMESIREIVKQMLQRIVGLENERYRVWNAERRTKAWGAPKESATSRRARYERELYMYSLVSPPKRWRPGSKRSRAPKIPQKILALLAPPPPSGDDSGSMAIVAVQEPGELQEDLNSTPLRKMQNKEYEAGAMRREGNVEEELRLRQELIGLARLHCQFEKNSREYDPTALARAHINLGSTYAAKLLWKQAMQHASLGLELVSRLDPDTENYDAVERGGHALLGDALMNIESPQPDRAMEHFAKAFPDGGSGEMPIAMALKLAECHATMGEDATEQVLQAAQSIRKGASEIRKLEAKLAQMPTHDTLRFQLQDRLYVIRPAMVNAERELSGLCQAAEEHLDKAIDMLMTNAIDRLEGKENVDSSQDLRRLYTRNSELMLQLAEVKQVRGAYTETNTHLGEILSVQQAYGILPAELLISTYTMKGNTLLKMGRPDEALEAYSELLVLQQCKEDGDPSRQKGEGEARKMMGNACISMKLIDNALSNYQKAYELFAASYGSNHSYTEEVGQRLKRIQEITGNA